MCGTRCRCCGNRRCGGGWPAWNEASATASRSGGVWPGAVTAAVSVVWRADVSDHQHGGVDMGGCCSTARSGVADAAA
ncbi:hypothetical protein MTO96_017084 [Rhipicephalus appendiculatus]